MPAARRSPATFPRPVRPTAITGPVDGDERCLVVTGIITAAFDRRCIPADCVASPSNMFNILGRRAFSAGRLAGLGARRNYARDHQGLRYTGRDSSKSLLAGASH